MQYTTEWSKTDTTAIAFRVSAPVRPGYTTICVGYTETGEFDGTYTSTATLKLANGKTFSFEDRGKRSATSYGGSETACAEGEGDLRGMDAQKFVESGGKERVGATKRDTKLIGTAFTA
jgi:hypothetical protein